MSIFTRRDNEPAAPPAPKTPPRSAPPVKPAAASQPDRTQIASGSKVVGEVSGSAELLIDGQVEGKIDLDSRVVVGSKGKVKGEIRARSVQIGGSVQGNVQGLERVEVLASGRLEGDMTSPQVHIADGAFFTGKVEMGHDADLKGKRPPERKLEISRLDPTSSRADAIASPRATPPPEPNLVGSAQGPGPGSDSPSPDKGGSAK